MSSFSYQVPVPDIHNCPVSAGAQSAKMLTVPHVIVSALLSGAQVTFMQTVCQQTLDTCSCSEALYTGRYDQGGIKDFSLWEPIEFTKYFA